MTRDEHRAKCIEANALAVARNMFPGLDLQSLDDLGPRLQSCYLSAGQEGLDSLHDIAHVVPLEVTEEMERAGFRAAILDDLDMRYTRIFAAMATTGDLTNGPETKA